MSRTAIRMLVGALLAVTVLTGCSIRPGAAAVVDGRVIPQSELARAHEELGALLGDPSAAQVLTVLIIEPLFVKAAEENGVGASVDDARKLLASAAEQNKLTDVPDYGDGAIAVARFSLANSALQNLSNSSDVLTALNDQIAKEDVSVNPMYGTWDGAGEGVKAVAFPWISGATTQ
jgi:hypothetical protein